MPPMPKLKPSRSLSDPYRKSLRLLEKAARARIERYQPRNRPHDEIVKSSLFAFLDHLPPGGRESVAADIDGATTDKQLHAVFHNLLTCLAAPMKTRPRHFDKEDSTPNQNVTGRMVTEINEGDQSPGENREHAPTSSKLCLQRDSHRCLITDEMESIRWDETECPRKLKKIRVKAGHIIPFSFASWKLGGPIEGRDIWGTLYRCFPALKGRIDGDRINDLQNRITLHETLNEYFRSFDLAFKATEIPGTYEIETFHFYPPSKQSYLPRDRQITIKTSDDFGPDPVLLECHYIMARILDESGMYATIERRSWEWGNLKRSMGHSLREDGLTDFSHIMRVALWAYITPA